MKFSEEQISNIKKQVISQIESTFPEDKKNDSIKQIETMNDEEFVEFLKNNNLINSSGSEGGTNGSCIFCSIVFGDVPSTKIGETDKALIILELNPISEGHSLVIPKTHLEKSEDIDQEIKDLAEGFAYKLKDIFGAKEVQILAGNIMGHEIINLLPIYDNETMESPRTKKTPEELRKTQEKILKALKENTQPLEQNPKEEIKKLKIEQISEKDTWLPKKIP